MTILLPSYIPSIKIFKLCSQNLGLLFWNLVLVFSFSKIYVLSSLTSKITARFCSQLAKNGQMWMLRFVWCGLKICLCWSGSGGNGGTEAVIGGNGEINEWRRWGSRSEAIVGDDKDGFGNEWWWRQLAIEGHKRVRWVWPHPSELHLSVAFGAEEAAPYFCKKGKIR